MLFKKIPNDAPLDMVIEELVRREHIADTIAYYLRIAWVLLKVLVWMTLWIIVCAPIWFFTYQIVMVLLEML